MSLPVVAIVGRPNVGKSTLFNRLVGFQKAVVHDRPGVTRDRLYEEADILGRSVILIDTGGIEPMPDTDLLAAMRLQSQVALEEADVIVFLVDGRQGHTPADAEVAMILRRAQKPLLLVVNKVDGPRQEDLSADFWQLGVTPMLTTSAEHGRGIYELAEHIIELLPEQATAEADPLQGVEIPLDGEEEEGEAEAFSEPIRIAVIGRPNIGKSTLVNQLLGENRHLVHDMPGTTMDPVDSSLRVGDQDFVIVDTAGVRKRARISDKLERFVALRAIRAIERCHISVLMIDATIGPTDQDARLAELVVDRGRGLVILMNKWDIVRDMEDVNARSTEDELLRRLPHVVWAPHIFISAKTGKGVHRVIPTILDVFSRFNQRISTSRLNRFLRSAVQGHSPPQAYHHPVRLYYATQYRVRPPTVMFFMNNPEGLKSAYKRYLSNRLREDFDFEGVPVRLQFRKRRGLREEQEG
jgi:GTP-binding protein